MAVKAKYVVTGGGDNVVPPGSAGVEIDNVRYEAGDEIPDTVRVPKWLIEQGYVAEAGKKPSSQAITTPVEDKPADDTDEEG